LNDKIKRELMSADIPETDKVYKKIKETGLISLTAEDQKIIGNMPQEILVKNPGKSLGELMSDQEMSAHLVSQKKKCSAAYERDIIYLISIGRLPEGIKGEEKRIQKNFTVEEGERIAESLGVRFAGIQPGGILPDIYLFNDDPISGISFVGVNLEEAQKKLDEVRQSFKKSPES